ncbi:hypothetical protein BDP27DRAFT_1425411 [Rhodocollybia butyracea]|uniref:Ribonuclease H1 N-terminal domain-containing protein n=1 Tax=Rhodocollybia butyracea TaxID=206335 RepID=A0A9P5PMP0_9AGAR|nr:hypothetical protein BDP27DRAFT_1425411 [Rhodocollybia butyracea]
MSSLSAETFDALSSLALNMQKLSLLIKNDINKNVIEPKDSTASKADASIKSEALFSSADLLDGCACACVYCTSPTVTEDLVPTTLITPELSSSTETSVSAVDNQGPTVVYSTIPGNRYYVVTKGLKVGVFEQWSEVSPLVTGVSRACSFRAATRTDAEVAFNDAIRDGVVEILCRAR